MRGTTTRDRVLVARYQRWTAETCASTSPAPIISGELGRLVSLGCTDWAGHHVQRRSCSGELIAVNHAVITSWAQMLPSPAMSSSEAELTASDLASSKSPSVKDLQEELSHAVRAEVRTGFQVARARRPLAKSPKDETRQTQVQFFRG